MNFAWQLKKDGLSERTIANYVKYLEMLVQRGARLDDGESVKNVIASQPSWQNSTKNVLVAAYKRYAQKNGVEWNAPRYKGVRKLPFIPLEKEIDDLIACCGKKTAVVLRLLKETGMRIGEALDLEWTDIDFERKIILLNRPEKHGNARVLKISDVLVSMLNRLPKTSKRVFGSKKSTITNNFNRQRKNAAKKLANPRLLRIHFHTFRHWKATMEYHRTKDILHVMKLLGHKSLNNTLVYTQLVEFEEESQFHSAVAKTTEEARKLIEAGFEYVCKHNGTMLFRKRK